MFDVFISHSSKDKETIVNNLVENLRNRDIDVWLDSNQILAGDTILDSVKKGIETACCTALIITPAFFDSFWTSLEIGLTLSKKEEHTIIPVLCDIDIDEISKRFPTLLTFKYLIMDSKNPNKCIQELANNIIQIKNRSKKISAEIAFKKAVRKLHSINSPITNTISILLTEYEKISHISIQSAIIHASQIAIIIINNLYENLSIKYNDEDSVLKKLDVLKTSHIGLSENLYEHFKLLISSSLDLRISALTNDTDRKILTEMSITAILEWYVRYLLHNKIIPIDDFEIVWPEELTYQDFVTMYEIDKKVLREDLIALPEITFEWYKYNPYTHIAIRSINTSKVVGYFAVLPITDELYDSIQSGYFKDNDLSTVNLRRYDVPDFYKLYIACVCIHPKYQNTSAFHKLYKGLINMMMELATEREIYITNIITEASTLQGEKFCKIIGLKPIIDTNLQTKIYGATLLPPSLQLKCHFGNKLIKFYREKYEEFKDLL